MKYNIPSPLVLVFLLIIPILIHGETDLLPLDIHCSDLLVSDQRHRGLALYDLETHETRIITDHRNTGYYASFSPGGRYICYKDFQPSNGGYLQSAAVYDISTGKSVSLSGWTTLCGTPAVSTGGRIAFTVGNELRVLDADFRILETFDLGIHVNLPAISPDGKKIAYTRPQSVMVLLDLSTGFREEIATPGESWWGPRFSPGGDKILVRSVSGRLAVIHLEKENLRITGKGENPAWVDNDTVSFLEKQIGGNRVVKTDIVLKDLSGREILRHLLNRGDANGILDDGFLVYSKEGKTFSAARENLGSPLFLNIKTPLSFSEKRNLEFQPESRISITAVNELTGVPYLHQVYDTPDDFNGHWACGASSALMAIQYYNTLPAHPITCSRPSSHTHDFGFYVAEKYSFNGYTYDIGGKDASGNTAYGGYGFIIQNNWADTKGNMAKYINRHGLASSVDWSETFTKAKTEIDAGHPFVLLNSLTSSGHYITCIGYHTDQHTLVFNDPYGNKNTPGYPSYDGARVFYDWPGYNNGYQNLNTVHCYIYCRGSVGPTPTPTPTPVPGTDVIVDNDDGSPAYVESSEWSNSASSGYNGLTYRWAIAGDTKSATWTGNLSMTGTYHLYAMFRQSANRVDSAKYVITAADGDHEVFINQNGSNELVTLHLGDFSLNAGFNTISLDAEGSTPGGNAVIADAVRFKLAVTPTPTPTPTPSPSPTPLPDPQELVDYLLDRGGSPCEMNGDSRIDVADLVLLIQDSK